MAQCTMMKDVPTLQSFCTLLSSSKDRKNILQKQKLQYSSESVDSWQPRDVHDASPQLSPWAEILMRAARSEADGRRCRQSCRRSGLSQLLAEVSGSWSSCAASSQEQAKSMLSTCAADGPRLRVISSAGSIGSGLLSEVQATSATGVNGQSCWKGCESVADWHMLWSQALHHPSCDAPMAMKLPSLWKLCRAGQDGGEPELASDSIPKVSVLPRIPRPPPQHVRSVFCARAPQGSAMQAA